MPMWFCLELMRMRLSSLIWMTDWLTLMTKVAKDPLKPLQMSIMRILREKIAAWEKLNPPTALKCVGERIANEILMHFRGQKKNAKDVSLSDLIETGSDGGALERMDAIGEETDLLELISNRQRIRQLQKAVEKCLTKQEQQVIRMRYGLAGYQPCRQREVATAIGLSRSYVSRIEKRALQKLRSELGE